MLAKLLENLRDDKLKEETEKTLLKHVKSLSGEEKINLINDINNIKGKQEAISGKNNIKESDTKAIDLILQTREVISKLKRKDGNDLWERHKDKLSNHKSEKIKNNFQFLAGVTVECAQNKEGAIKIKNKFYLTDNGKFALHHIVPKVKLDKDNTINPNMVRLGPLPELRLDDPGSESIDSGIKTNGDNTPVSENITNHLNSLKLYELVSFKLHEIKDEKSESPKYWYLIPSKLNDENLKNKIEEKFLNNDSTRKGFVTHIEYEDGGKNPKKQTDFGIGWSELTVKNLGENLFLELNDKLINKDKKCPRCFTKGKLEITFEAEIKQEFVNTKAELALEKFKKLLNDKDDSLYKKARELKDEELKSKRHESNEKKKKNFLNFLSKINILDKENEYLVYKPKNDEIETEEDYLNKAYHKCKGEEVPDIKYCDDYKNSSDFLSYKEEYYKTVFQIKDANLSQKYFFIEEKEDTIGNEEKIFDEKNPLPEIKIILTKNENIAEKNSNVKTKKDGKKNRKDVNKGTKENNERVVKVSYEEDSLKIDLEGEDELNEEQFSEVKNHILEMIKKEKKDIIEKKVEDQYLDEYDKLQDAKEKAKEILKLFEELENEEKLPKEIALIYKLEEEKFKNAAISFYSDNYDSKEITKEENEFFVKQIFGSLFHYDKPKTSIQSNRSSVTNVLEQSRNKQEQDLTV